MADHDHDHQHRPEGVCGGHHHAEDGPHRLHDHAAPRSAGSAGGNGAAGDLHFGRGPAGVDLPGVSQSRLVRIEQDILAKNGRYATANRRRLEALGILAVNLISSPGAGKTTLLVATLERLMAEGVAVAVIEGDQETANDAARIRATGAPAVQINTGRGCHLDAHMVGHALDGLPPLPPGGMLFVENVGNLVCPAGFDLGEARKVVLLSTAEGDDKPLKYPDAFAAADLMILSKTDLLPHLDFDAEACIQRARRVNPALRVLPLSARTGAGMEGWLKWLRSEAAPLRVRAAAGEIGVESSDRRRGA